MQTGQLHHGGASSHQFAADMTALFPSHQDWPTPSPKRTSPARRNPLRHSMSTTHAPQDPYLFVSDIGHVGGPSPQDAKRTYSSPNIATSVGFEQMNLNAHTSSMASFNSNPALVGLPTFTPMNSNDFRMQEPYTISPLQTRFEGDLPTYESSNTYSADGSIQSAPYSNSGQWSDATEQHSPGQGYDLMDTSNERTPGPYVTGRRRRSENVIPGSARAIYLEKNRKAASKCRTKQKRQQEDLIEAARDQERRNKVLKSEVEILKSDLRDLMELVGAHNDCPDARLRKYIQMEADRLAAKGSQSPLTEIFSSQRSSKGSASPGKTPHHSPNS